MVLLKAMEVRLEETTSKNFTFTKLGTSTTYGGNEIVQRVGWIAIG